MLTRKLFAHYTLQMRRTSLRSLFTIRSNLAPELTSRSKYRYRGSLMLSKVRRSVLTYSGRWESQVTADCCSVTIHEGRPCEQTRNSITLHTVNIYHGRQYKKATLATIFVSLTFTSCHVEKYPSSLVLLHIWFF